MPSPVADILRRAAALNLEDPRREGNVVALAAGRDVIVAGDLHGHRQNLRRILAYADVTAQADRRLVLQEIIHGPADPRTGHDRSIELLLRAARLKVARPQQVLFVLANHDVAQISGNEITRAGMGACEAFARGVAHCCGAADAADVLAAVEQFLRSLPMAVRCPGGVLIAHSLPSPRRMALAGEGIPAGPYRPDDLRRGGSVYEWTWGRGQSNRQVEALAEALGATFFVLSHRHIETGCEPLGPRAIVVTSEHDHGCVVQFRSQDRLTGETIGRHVKPIVGLVRASPRRDR